MRIATALALCAALASPARAAESLPWDAQLREMGHLIVHLSNINVINGLNLSDQQVRDLRGLAVEVELLAPSAPDGDRSFGSPLDSVRSTYMETRAYLLRGEKVPEDVQKRVAQARDLESKAIRLSLSKSDQSASPASCESCHCEPDWSRLNEPCVPLAEFQRDDVRAKAYLAHLSGNLGWRGAREVRRVAPRVDSTLNEWQRQTLGQFSCCLVPPQDLSDPARIGQAPADPQTVGLLEKMRDVSDRQWPWARLWATGLLVEGQRARSPDLSGPQEDVFRHEVQGILDEARAMSDVDFKLDKESLAARLKTPPVEPKNESERQFKTAFFLLLPGSVEAYDALHARMAAH